MTTKIEPPTKEQVKEAKAQLRAAKKVIRAATTKRRRGFISHHRKMRKRSRESRSYFLWVHDFHTVIRSAAHSSDLPAADMVALAEAAADRMAEVINRRKPATEEEAGMYYRSRMRDVPATRRWREWQSFFDDTLHVLCERTTLRVDEVLARAEAIADAAQAVIDRRRPHGLSHG